MREAAVEGDLIVSEGNEIAHRLHLRIVGKEGPQFDRYEGYSLCQQKLTWDTKISIYDFQSDRDSEINCHLCLLLAEKNGLC